ncbi:FGGY-family carbohydrate kinase [Thermofilum sp.]|uniref:FGGY family carbohydrate kinase n=3 Tax=Thermofilum sp. TaxID=1961369 RepID=UPI00316819A3
MYSVIDVGTTGVKLAVFDASLNKIHFEKTSIGYKTLQTGRIEQDSQLMAEVVKGYARKAKSLGARKLALTTYRASVVAWNRNGSPISNILTWIDGRGKEVIDRLPSWLKAFSALSSSMSRIIRPDTPAILMRWLYDNVEGVREKVLSREAYVWTLDSFLLYSLTGRYVSDVTNSTLTGLVHPKNLEAVDIVSSILGLPKSYPEIVDSVEDFGAFEGLEIKVSIADQQSASVFHGLLDPGRVGSVHGTGSFVEQSASGFTMPKQGLVPVIIAGIEGKRYYGVEGFLRTSGIAVDWLRNAGFYSTYEEMEQLASNGKLKSILLPFFGGLRVPEAPELRGVMLGLDPSVSRADVLLGLAWGVSLYIAYLLRTIMETCGKPVQPLWASGGYSQSNVFLQTLANATGMEVARPVSIEATIMGALKLLLYSDGKISLKELKNSPSPSRVFKPEIDDVSRERIFESFREVLEVLVKWEKNPLLGGKF